MPHLYGKDHFACPGEENEEKGVLPVIQRTTWWEKGHRMALSSGSSVSEDVWTLIKMCRASGRVAVSFFYSLSTLSPSFPGLSLRAAISSCAVYACDRLVTFKAPGECHLDGSCWVVYVRRAYATRGCRHFLPSTGHRLAGSGARRRTRSLRLPVWHPIVALYRARLAKTEMVPPTCHTFTSLRKERRPWCRS